jgi:superfamily I DNA and/or RNA helicase
LVKGFSFQEQFEVTTEMDTLLKNDMKMWNTYLTLLEKIDQLTKTNALYKKYNQIYPSAELQMNWLKPKPSRF